MSFLPLAKLVPFINGASAVYDGYKAIKWLIDQKIKKRTDEGIRLGKEEIRQMLDGAFVAYAIYAAWNVVLLASACFVNRIFAPDSHTLLAAGYSIITMKMLLSGRLVAMKAYNRWQKEQLIFSYNGSLYRLLDAQIGPRVEEDVKEEWRVVQWIYKKLGIPTKAQTIIVDGLFDTLHRNVCKFALCFVIAWGLYMAITHYLATPLLAALGDMNCFLALLYPFYASISMLAQDLFANQVWGALFAVLFCVLFARTTWCIYRRYGVLAGLLAWILFLVATTAILYRAHFTCTGTVLFVQTIFTFEKCVAGHYVYPGLSD